MLQNSRLGVAGGIILERINGRYIAQNTSLNSVAGAVQLFRRDCFETIGGMLPLELGGEDSAAEIMARMHGWAVCTMPELEVRTNRPVTMNSRNVLMARINRGRINYSLGYHPLFQIVSGIYRMLERPYVLGGALMIGAYFWSRIKKMPRRIPRATIDYLRDEQLRRLRPGLSLRRLLRRP
jgi:GT2 family glycosyltransferase